MSNNILENLLGNDDVDISSVSDLPDTDDRSLLGFFNHDFV